MVLETSMQDMDFFELRDQQLNEAAMPGGIRSALNQCQEWWNANHEKLQLWNPENPKKVRLYPILNPPFDVIRKGGIAVIGYNPGAGGGRAKEFDAAVEKTMKKQGGLPPVYDTAKKKWYYITDYANKTGMHVDVSKKRYKNKKQERKLSAFNTKEWWSAKKKTSGLSELGAHNYHAALNKMIEDMIESVPKDISAPLRAKRNTLMHANFVPFNSRKDGFESKAEVIKASVPWMKAYIKTVQPSMIICPIGTYKLLKTHLGMKKTESSTTVYTEPSDNEAAQGLSPDNPTTQVKDKTGKMRKVSLQRFYLTGELQGIPVVAFTHWTGNQKGGPTKATWKKPENVELIAKDICDLLRNPREETEVVWDEVAHTIKPRKARAKAKVKPAKQPAVSKPSKATFDPRFDAFEKLNADRLPKGSKDYKQFNKDAKSMTYDDLLAKWAVPGKLKRP